VVSPKKHFRSSFQLSANVVCTCSTDHRFRSNQCNATNQQISLSLLSSKRVLDIGCRFLNSAPSECPRDSVRLSLANNSAFSDENTEFGLLRCSYACEQGCVTVLLLVFWGRVALATAGEARIQGKIHLGRRHWLRRPIQAACSGQPRQDPVL
jgi:hypothetical protein